jgi:hypothetical protein
MGGIAVLLVQNSAQIPPLSTTPLTVKVIMSPMQTGSGATVMLPPDNVPLSWQPSQASSQHSPLSQQFCPGRQHSVGPQQLVPTGQ